MTAVHTRLVQEDNGGEPATPNSKTTLLDGDPQAESMGVLVRPNDAGRRNGNLPRKTAKLQMERTVPLANFPEVRMRKATLVG